MKRCVVLLIASTVLWSARNADAQSSETTPADLASSWTLVSIERGVSSGTPERAQQARGLLIFDSAGHAFEWCATTTRQLPDTPLTMLGKR